MPASLTHGLGWQRSLPDIRDYAPGTCSATKALRRLKRLPPVPERPSEVDLREYFPPAYDQGPLNSSPAHACVGLVEYFERRVNGRFVEPSRLFLYHVARKLLGWKGDTGTDLRTVLKAMKRCGIPPERHHPYQVERFDDTLDAFLYSFTKPYRSVSYVRLDTRNVTGKDTLRMVTGFLAAGFPCVFGFPAPGPLPPGSDIAYRPTFDKPSGGQAVVAVGYDDKRLTSTKGALLIRNSWGADWGEEGYGWLPYAFVEAQLAVDFWTLLKSDWLRSAEFLRPVFQQ